MVDNVSALSTVGQELVDRWLVGSFAQMAPRVPAYQRLAVDERRRRLLELAKRLEVDPELPPANQLMAALDSFLAWIEENAEGYAKLLEGGTTHAEVRELVDGVRAATAQRILEGLKPPDGPPPPELRTAVNGWLWFMDGAITDWLAHRDIGREQLLGLLLGTLYGAVTASGAPGVAERLAGPG